MEGLSVLMVMLRCDCDPCELPHGRSDDWPSVVLEISFSETQSKLMSDVRFWLHESDSDVKIVLTLKIQRQRPEIIFEEWTINNREGPAAHPRSRDTPLAATSEHLAPAQNRAGSTDKMELSQTPPSPKDEHLQG